MSKTITVPPSPHTVKVPSELTVPIAERLITNIGKEEIPERGLILDLRECTDIYNMAGWILGNTLRRFAGKGISVHLLQHQYRDSATWNNVFIKNGLGLYILRYAHKVFLYKEYQNELKNGTDIRDELDQIRIPLLIQTGEYSINIGLHNNPFQAADKTLFQETIGYFKKEVNGQPNLFIDEIQKEVITASFEMAQNIYDHSSDDSIISDVFSSLTVSMFDGIDTNRRNYTNYTEGKHWDEYYSKYLVSVKKQFKDAVKGWIEITLTDNGIGVAGRHSREAGIYWKEIRAEEKVLELALTEEESVKLITKKNIRGDPGYGFTNIEEGLNKIYGFGLFRTGRKAAICNGLEALSRLPEQSQDTLLGENKFTSRFRILEAELGYMPGSMLVILFPKLH